MSSDLEPSSDVPDENTPPDPSAGGDAKADESDQDLVAALGAMLRSPRAPTASDSNVAARIDNIRSRAGSADRYQIRSRIGRGGQGAVYEVWDEDLARRAAMKVVLGRVGDSSTEETPPADPETLSRFLEEAQVTGQLDHPGVVPVHELGLDHEGQVYFTMRLVRGDDLSRVFSKVQSGEDGWTRVRALGAVLKACEAVAYAHSRNIIHRDLKPSNLMVGSFGEVYVMDWGLARVLGREEHHDLRLRDEPESDPDDEAPDSPLLTRDGRVLGTPCYMPPEQAEGRIDDLSPASDVYSMGAVLYQLLSGTRPFAPPDESVSARVVLARVIESSPARLRGLAPETPPELIAICEKAMARSMADRYPDMNALASDLRAYLENRVVQAYATGAFAELRKWIGRNRGWATTGAVALALLVVTLGWALVERGRANDEATRATTAADAERRAKEDAIAAREEARKSERKAVAEREHVLRLYDSKLLADYLAEVDDLWPAVPAKVPELKAWLQKSRELHARLPQHEDALDRLRDHAIPRSAEQLRAEREAHQLYPKLVKEAGRLSWLRRIKPVVSGGPAPELPPLKEEERDLTAAELARLALDCMDLKEKIFGADLRSAALGEQLAALDPPGGREWAVIAWARYSGGRFDGALAAMEKALARTKPGEDFRGWSAILRESMVLFRGEGAAERLAAHLDHLEVVVDRLENQVSRPRFLEENAEQARQYGNLDELVMGLRALGAKRGPLVDVQARLEWAERVEELTVTGANAAEQWKEAISSIANESECPLYGGRTLSPQIGLLPLDRNPRTTLWEFWHPQTGTRPEPNSDYDPETPGRCNRWLISESTALVFVLIPAGTYRIGAELTVGAEVQQGSVGLRVTGVTPGSLAERAGLLPGDVLTSVNDVAVTSEESLDECTKTLVNGETIRICCLRDGEEKALSAEVANFDPSADALEAPVHEVTLRPYFISKYEVTQAQWTRSSAKNKTPSIFWAGRLPQQGANWVQGLNPVENVAWTDVLDTVENLGLSIPTEAQWEAAARGGTGSLFWTGDTVASLQGAANLADAFFNRLQPTMFSTTEIDDGYLVHAPVGSYRANPFGLHDVHGGVAECSLDTQELYRVPVKGEDGLRSSARERGIPVTRGGSWYDVPKFARSSKRLPHPREMGSQVLGVRPVRLLDE